MKDSHFIFSSVYIVWLLMHIQVLLIGLSVLVKTEDKCMTIGGDMS